MGMHAEAAQTLSERARLSPQNPMVWNDLGVELVAARRSKEAHEAFIRALRAVTDYPPSLYNLGRLALHQYAAEKAKEQPSENSARAYAIDAIRFLEASLLRDPLDHRTHAALTVAYSHVGDTVRSHFHLTKASEVKPVEVTQSKPKLLGHLLDIFTKSQLPTGLPFLFSTGSELQLEKNRSKDQPYDP